MKLTPEEQAHKDKLTAARVAVKHACEARNALQTACPHRIAGQEGFTYENGCVDYGRPVCGICDGEFEFDNYCPKSDDHFCWYNVDWSDEPVRGHDIGLVSYEVGDGNDEAECIHCGLTWTRYE